MTGVIGEILLLAVGVAISPIAVIATIIMLMSPRAKGAGLGFLVGWLCGIVVAVTVFTLLGTGIFGHGAGASRSSAGTIKIVLGVLLLFLALRQWRKRPGAGEDPPMPKWMSAVDSMTAGRAFLPGLALAAINPKNLLLGAAAGVAIGAGGLTVGGKVVAIVVFTVIAGISVAGPVVAYLMASDRMAGPLGSLRGWLVRNSATVMAVLLLVIGVAVLGKGLGTF